MGDNMKSKQGISLMVLIISISVMLILLSIIIVSVNNVSGNSKLAAFATDLSSIEDLTSSYYMKNNNFPIKVEDSKTEEEMVMNQGTLLSRVGEENKEKFVDELKLNNDYNEESDDLGEYYPIDLRKLDIESTKRGTEENGNLKDIYVVSYPSMNIYYIDGIKVKNEKYFSLSSKLTNKVKINNNMAYKNDNKTLTQSIDGITVKKITKGWTNNIGIYVQANLKSGEELYLQATNVNKKKLITNDGNNEFSFNDLSEINGFTSDESNAFKSSNQKDKKITFIKQNGQNILGKIDIDMSNYETNLPNYTINPSNFLYKDDYNMVPINVSDSDSGIKEVRYEYLTKYDENGNLQKYYTNVDEYDTEYLKSKGKRAIADKNGDITLKIDKDIQGIQLIVIDKAGNILSKNESGTPLMIGLYNEENTTYIGMDLKENTEKLLLYNLIFVNHKGISSFDVSTSLDGVNYSSPTTVNVNSSSDENIKIVEQRNENIGNIKFLKVTSIDNSASKNKYTRIFKLSNKNTLEVGKITSENKTFNLKNTSTYYNPIIPKGFAPINEGDAIWGSADGWNNGLVIRDEKGNEFVWIPVESSNDDEFNNKFVTYAWNLDESTFSNYKETEDDEFNLMKNSVRKNGGFYIARYESGEPNNGNKSTLDGSVAPVSKRNQKIWNLANTDKLMLLARCMYPNLNKISEYNLPTNIGNSTGVISTLIYGRQWDAALKFIQKDNSEYIQKSYDYGNIGTKKLNNSGSNDKYAIKNIYDMAGNFEEFTNEHCLNSTLLVLRGGSAYSDKTDSIIANRNNNINNNYVATYGFRVALYINN